MMGLEDPNLFNSAITNFSSLVLATMVDNFSMMSSKAPMTETAFSCLLLKSSMS